MDSPPLTKRVPPVFLTIGAALSFAAALIGFPIAYGAFLPFLVWFTLVLLLGCLLRRHRRKLSGMLLVLAGSAMLLWPVDALYKFPVLRTFYEFRPFGPTVTALRSPSEQKHQREPD